MERGPTRDHLGADGKREQRNVKNGANVSAEQVAGPAKESEDQRQGKKEIVSSSVRV